MYSVEPQPTCPLARKSTNAVFPFSRQGVIRATSVSPFMKRIPDPKARSTTTSGVCPLVGMLAMSR